MHVYHYNGWFKLLRPNLEEFDIEYLKNVTNYRSKDLRGYDAAHSERDVLICQSRRDVFS